MTDTRPAVPAPVELRARIASAAVIIPAVIIAVVVGTPLFAVIIAIAVILALREWHRLVNGNHEARETIASSIAVIAALLLFLSDGRALLGPAAILLGGALITALSAGMRRSWVLWHGFGVLYIGIPALALVGLHDIRSGLVVGGIFAAVWAADTAALFAGRMIGGRRLAPTLSPNKTWAGFIGGLVAAGLGEIIYVALADAYLGAAPTNFLRAGAFGVFIGIAAACGDLFESWVKRRCHAKNSGSLIPGHGGVLDRIDSLLFAAPAAALLLFLTRVELFGAQP